MRRLLRTEIYSLKRLLLLRLRIIRKGHHSLGHNQLKMSKLHRLDYKLRGYHLPRSLGQNKSTFTLHLPRMIGNQQVNRLSPSRILSRLQLAPHPQDQSMIFWLLWLTSTLSEPSLIANSIHRVCQLTNSIKSSRKSLEPV